MLAILSPAKKMNVELFTGSSSDIRFLGRTLPLVEELKRLDPLSLGHLMAISEKLAAENYARFQAWETPFDSTLSAPAILAYRGDAYVGLDAQSLDETDLVFAQHHLRILSGLYGSLRPLDRIMPYRLEMGGKFHTSNGQSLSKYWQDAITRDIIESMPDDSEQALVNLASDEYSSVIDVGRLPFPVVSPQFYDKRNDTYKIVSSFAKKARGTMAAWLIRNRVASLTTLTSFCDNGYVHNDELSRDGKPAFCRDAP